jgi:centromere protein C
LLEDEFVIDESDRSFVSRPWITIPRKGELPKHYTVSPPENTTYLQGKKSREKHHNILPKTLASDKHSHKANPVEKSKPSGKTILGTSCTDELENNCRSTDYEMDSENAEKQSGSKRSTKQKQRRTLKANIVKEHLNMEQCKDENKSMSHIAQDKLQRNSHTNKKNHDEMRNDHIFQKQMLSGGKCLY